MIDMLKMNGIWTDDLDIIKFYIQDYFLNLFTGSDVSLYRGFSNSFQIRINYQEHLNLFSPISYDEIKVALFSMNGFKSPRPDGLHPLFYQKLWNCVHPSFCGITKEMFCNY